MSSTPVLVDAAEEDVAALCVADNEDSADTRLLDGHVSSVESMYTEKSWIAPAAFASMTAPELNTIMLTSMISMLERGAISSTSADIEAFNNMSRSIHGQVFPADAEFNSFSTMSARDADLKTRAENSAQVEAENGAFDL